jgi:hypothetical protein
MAAMLASSAPAVSDALLKAAEWERKSCWWEAEWLKLVGARCITEHVMSCDVTDQHYSGYSG